MVAASVANQPGITGSDATQPVTTDPNATVPTESMVLEAKWTPIHERAVRYEVVAPMDLASRIVLNLYRHLIKNRLPELDELVPAARSLLVTLRPETRLSFDLLKKLETVAARVRPVERPSLYLETPVEYGGVRGLDLLPLAQWNNLTSEELVKLHSAAPYLVAFMGACPGFPFLSPNPSVLDIPEQKGRRLIPAGSIVLSPHYSGICPYPMVGPWHIIGYTTLQLFDPNRSNPSLLMPGDRVCFGPVPHHFLQ